MAYARSQVEFVGVESEQTPQWGWFVALGAVLLVLGLFAGANLVAATAATVFYVGVLMTVAAALLIVHAFQVKNWAGFFFWSISGGLYAIAGVITLANPALSALLLTLFLGIALATSGNMRIASSFQLEPHSGWGWLMASGVITFLLGAVFILGWPVNSIWLLGMMLSIDLTFQGVALLAFGVALKTNVGAFNRPAKDEDASQGARSVF